jgi:hypothetical protein
MGKQLQIDEGGRSNLENNVGDSEEISRKMNDGESEG